MEAQGELQFDRGWGGYRKGAGGKKKPDAGVSHLKRSDLKRRYPVHVTVRLYACEVIVDHAETVREVDGVTGIHMLSHKLPDRLHGRISNKHHNDGAALGGLLDVEQGLAGLPAVARGAVPVFAKGF